MPAAPPQAGVLEGTLAFAAETMPPAGAVAEVLLVGEQFETFASATYTLTGEPGPPAFRVEYDPSALDPNGGYALLARVLVDGQTAWATLEPALVISHGYPTTGITLTLTANTAR